MPCQNTPRLLEIRIYSTILLSCSLFSMINFVMLRFVIPKGEARCCFYYDDFGWKTNEAGIMYELPIFLWTGLLLSILGFGVSILGCFRKRAKAYWRGVALVGLTWTIWRGLICVAIGLWNRRQTMGTIYIGRSHDFTDERLHGSVVLEGVLFGFYCWRANKWRQVVEHELPQTEYNEVPADNCDFELSALEVDPETPPDELSRDIGK